MGEGRACRLAYKNAKNVLFLKILVPGKEYDFFESAIFEFLALGRWPLRLLVCKLNFTIGVANAKCSHFTDKITWKRSPSALIKHSEVKWFYWRWAYCSTDYHALKLSRSWVKLNWSSRFFHDSSISSIPVFRCVLLTTREGLLGILRILHPPSVSRCFLLTTLLGGLLGLLRTIHPS